MALREQQATLTDAQLRFLADNPFVGVLTTLRRDGSPHSTVVEQIDKLAKEYLGEDEYPWANPDKRRLKVLIHPAHVDSSV